jgi:hypothetical protein
MGRVCSAFPFFANHQKNSLLSRITHSGSHVCSVGYSFDHVHPSKNLMKPPIVVRDYTKFTEESPIFQNIKQTYGPMGRRFRKRRESTEPPTGETFEKEIGSLEAELHHQNAEIEDFIRMHAKKHKESECFHALQSLYDLFQRGIKQNLTLCQQMTS